MYDFYPAEWGPANHSESNPRSHEAVQAALDLRESRHDHWAQRPDDN